MPINRPSAVELRHIGGGGQRNEACIHFGETAYCMLFAKVPRAFPIKTLHFLDIRNVNICTMPSYHQVKLSDMSWSGTTACRSC